MAPRRASDARAEADLDFERLYGGHRGEVFRAALRELGNIHDAEDVTQAAFIDAYRAVFRGSRPEAPRAWLLAIAENVRRRRFRTALRRPREEPLDPEAALGAEPTTEQTNALRSALAGLPPQQRAVFLLREIVGSPTTRSQRSSARRSAPCRCCCSGHARRCAPSSSLPPSRSAAAYRAAPGLAHRPGLAQRRSRSDATCGRRARGCRAGGHGGHGGLATSPTDAAPPPVVHTKATTQCTRRPRRFVRSRSSYRRDPRRQVALATKPLPSGNARRSHPHAVAAARATPRRQPRTRRTVRPGPAAAPPAQPAAAVTVVEDAATSLPAPPTVSVPLPPVPPAPSPPPLPAVPTPLLPLPPTPPLPPPPPVP